jgi:diadenosine tetraphosphatase ApaH/serine/threonine PP2A family protein phosphatase
MEAPICFVGHSHVPVTFLQDEMISYTLGDSVQVPPSCKAIVNVGSVGQPRDKDPRACYAIYDTDQQKVTIRRTPYDIESVVSRIRDAGLPASLGERLRTGR